MTSEIKNKVQFGQSEQRFLGRGFAQGWGIYFHHNREKTGIIAKPSSRESTAGGL
jgi:hypothetical protein